MGELIVEKGSAPARPRAAERTIILGYLFAASFGYLVFALADMVWSGQVISRFALGFSALLFAIALIPLWIAVAIPFAIVRAVSGSRGFSSSGRATLWGSITGLLTIPFGVVMSRIGNLEGLYPPFGTDLMQTIEYRWPYFALAGAMAGLAYWGIEFSSGPSALVALVGDTRPIRGTKALISRRVGAAIASIAAAGILLPIVQWWWSPHVSQAARGAGVEVTFVREWPTKHSVGFVAWSQRPSRVTSLSHNVVAVRDERGLPDWEKSFPNIEASGAAASDREIAVPDELVSHAAFWAIDLQTGEVLHREPDPDPRDGGFESAAVNLAMSPDGSRLAVAYGKARAGLPVRLYDTHDWHLLSTMETVPQRQLGSQAIAFSNDGSLLAFDSGQELVIADAQSGKTLHSIVVSPTSIAFSPGSDMVAVETAGLVRSIDVFRLADGIKLASHPTGTIYESYAMVWDSLGRFIGFIDGSDTVRLWNLSTADGSGVTLHVRPRPSSLALSPDGRCLAVGNGDFVSLFRIAEHGASAGNGQGCG